MLTGYHGYFHRVTTPKRIRFTCTGPTVSRFILRLILLYILSTHTVNSFAEETAPTTKVFIFAGQSNMEGADSNVERIQLFPPFRGLDQPQEDVLFRYNLGRNDAHVSDGWVPLQSVNRWVGPELSFARELKRHDDSPIAIIKCAVGGTTLGADWNPKSPQGFMLYPKALSLVQEALADLKKRGVPYQLEGFMWHQGENDMFNDEFRAAYGDNLTQFIASWRKDLDAPTLQFFIGELHCKSIWGMDNRSRMYGISQGQKAACNRDPHAHYVPNNHNAMTVNPNSGLHYHFGTLGQLGHGMSYADAYLNSIKARPITTNSYHQWPKPAGQLFKLYVLAGHRNMEGERAFVDEASDHSHSELLPNIPFRYSIGGGYRQSADWEPLYPNGFYETFGPELSFAHAFEKPTANHLAIAKFTHSGSQIIDWTPEGSDAKDRNLYPDFIAFVQRCRQDLERRGYDVQLAGIIYHLGENDMCFHPYKRNAIENLSKIVTQSRTDLGLPELPWIVSLQPPFPNENLAEIDVTSELKALDQNDPHLRSVVLDADFPLDRNLLMDADGVSRLGTEIAAEALKLP